MDAILIAKMLLGLTDDTKDELLAVLYEGAKAHALAYCRLTEVKPQMKMILASMIVASYRRLGTEHIKSHTYSNVSETFDEAHLETINAQLEPFKVKLRVY